jgi:hypothetical protein
VSQLGFDGLSNCQSMEEKAAFAVRSTSGVAGFLFYLNGAQSRELPFEHGRRAIMCSE